MDEREPQTIQHPTSTTDTRCPSTDVQSPRTINWLAPNDWA